MEYTVKLLNKLKQASRKLKSELQVLVLAYKDKRTPVLAKLLVGVTVGYLLSPIDLIPDFIPVLGILDDLIIVPVLIRLSLRMIPKEVLDEARAAAKTNPERLKKSNWAFAVLIIAIWLVTLLLSYRAIS
ncbi:YkvA family protein [Polluticoccus soli]|uniref:YkvA family protein n=1 Tax=Polluticoccus soli TaxID=3034150 RepID=UPI0023E16329|nr:YkvA family protein [Flavipsychrobacter sp. JY13-12]